MHLGHPVISQAQSFQIIPDMKSRMQKVDLPLDCGSAGAESEAPRCEAAEGWRTVAAAIIVPHGWYLVLELIYRWSVCLVSH